MIRGWFAKGTNVDILMKKLQFYLRFHTTYGQSLFVTGNTNALGNHDHSRAFPLKYLNEECWYGTLDVAASTGHIRYSYYLKNADGSIVEELSADRIVEFTKHDINEYQAIDTWNHAGDYQNAFYTAPFQQVLLKEHKAPSNKTSKALHTRI